jgi:mono/diheme cytochrome c family protein
MADLMLFGLFNNVETTADVVDEVRALGVSDDDMEIMSNVPYPAGFFGRKHSRLWFLPFVFGGALVGALLATFITFGTPAIYPIHVGGQELTPVPPSAMMYFELISLFSMVGMFIGFLLQNKFPILVREMYDERITDGYIGVQVRAESSVAEQVVRVFEAHHAEVVKREDAAEFKPQGIRHLLFWGGVSTAGAVVMLLPLLLSYEVIEPGWVNTMSDTVRIGHQEGPRRAAPPEAIPIQGPVMIGNDPASAPLPATANSIERGATLFGINCAHCHGANADYGAGGNENANVPTIGPYFTGIPAIIARAPQLSDDDIFRRITLGWGRMPSLAENLSPGETWDIINFIRSLDTGDAG